MKHIRIVLLALVAVVAASCKPTERIYDGPNIAYFDKGGLTRSEIVEETRVVSFNVISPLKVGYDRQYKLIRKFGSTLETSEYSIVTPMVTIKAGAYSGEGKVSFDPTVLAPKPDTLVLGIEAQDGDVAAFDNTMTLVVSQRCQFVPELYVGTYDFFCGLFGLGTQREVVLATEGEGGAVKPNAIKVKEMYGTMGADVEIILDDSDPTVVRPVIKMQYAGVIKVTDQNNQTIDADMQAMSTDQYSFPKLPATPNTSTFSACTGELNLKVTLGVFVEQEDGSQLESHLYGSPSSDVLTKLTPPYNARTTYLRADNMECRGLVSAQ